MSERVRPELKFETLPDLIAEVRKLRRVGYEKHGNWSLPQIAWHVGKVAEPTLKSPTNRSATPEQAARWTSFLETIRRPGGPSSFPAGPSVTPTKDDDAEIDRFIELIERLDSFPDTLLDTGPLGAQPIDQVREAHRLHAAHHLGFLKSKYERRTGLQYTDIDAAIVDIEQLRKGCTQTGGWSLPEVCWHLNKTTLSRLQPPPFPPDTDEMRNQASTLSEILASGQIPKLVAPPTLTPPASAAETDVDDLIASLRRVKNHHGFSPHRLFGTMDDADSRRHILIHAAHHLSFLVPTTGSAAGARLLLQYASVADLIADVECLRKGYRQLGNWSLAAAAWHCGLPLGALQPLPAGAQSTPEQAAFKKNRLDAILAAGVIPPGQPTPPGTDPKTEAPPLDESAIDKFIAGLKRLQSATQPTVMFGPVGLCSLDEFRRFILIHSASHLKNLIPTN